MPRFYDEGWCWKHRPRGAAHVYHLFLIAEGQGLDRHPYHWWGSERKISLQVRDHQVIKGSVPLTYLLLYWFAKTFVTTYHWLGSLEKRERGKKRRKYTFSRHFQEWEPWSVGLFSWPFQLSGLLRLGASIGTLFLFALGGAMIPLSLCLIHLPVDGLGHGFHPHAMRITLPCIPTVRV